MSGVSGENMNVFKETEVMRAYLDCRKRKRNTVNALEFEFNLPEDLNALFKELNSGNYKPGRSVCFVTCSPKPREIFAASFRDRIVHHLLVRKIEPYWDKVFIHDSYACRREKGTHAAVDRLKSFVRSITKGGRVRAFYLQLDIRNFFMSIDRNLLFRFLEKGLRKQFNIPLNRLPLGCENLNEFEAYRNLLKTFVFHNPTENFERRSPIKKWNMVKPEKSLFNCKKGKGIPIGNLTSQFFANVYMNKFDQFVKHDLKVKHYIRYVDDFVILGETRDELKELLDKIREFFKRELFIELKNDIRIRSLSSGVNFLGYVQHVSHRLPRNRVVNNFMKKYRKYLKELEKVEGKVMRQVMIEKDFEPVSASYEAHLNRSDSFKIQKIIFRREVYDM
jgi:RNA-directed DNA polymerase